MTVRFYQNTDPGAPPLRGNTAGDLLNLLTKCLVEGYGDKTPAGWSRPFVSGNTGVFRQGPGGNDMYLRVDDSMTTVLRRHARVRGYTSMTDVDTGAGPFPSDDQVAGGGYWFVQYNSTQYSADARRWVVIADETFFFLIIHTAASSTNQTAYSELYYFGDFISNNPADAFNTALACGNSSTDDNTTSGTGWGTTGLSSTLNTANSRVFAARRWDQVGGAVNINLHSDSLRGSINHPGYGGLPYPNPADGRLYMAPIWVGDPNTGASTVRGRIPGLWNPLHSAPFERNDTFEGQGDLAGKSFFAWRQGNSSVVFEVSDTWYD